MPPSHLRKARKLLTQADLLSGSSRRRFLQTSLAAASGVLLSNCARNLSSSSNASPEASPASPGGAAPANASDPKTLYVYSWTNYSNPELIKKFEQKTGIKAVFDIYDSNEVMMTKMKAGGGSAYSIIYPTDYTVAQMITDGMITTLDQNRIKGMKALKSKWKSPVYDPNNAHSVPIAWGTTGLMFNPKRIDTEIKGWDYLWDNISSLERKVTLIDDVRETMGAALLHLGHSLNTTDPKQIEAAYKKLVELKPAIASFMTNGWEDQLASGDLLVTMAYSTDAFALIFEKPELEYIIPDAGASLWTDTMVIPKSAPNVDAAYQWINFMLEPEVSAFMAEKQGFATPIEASFKLLPKELQANRKLFPSDRELEKCEGIAPLAKEVVDIYDRYWTQLKSS